MCMRMVAVDEWMSALSERYTARCVRDGRLVDSQHMLLPGFGGKPGFSMCCERRQHVQVTCMSPIWAQNTC